MITTAELPATPARDRTITASDWAEAPPSVPPEAIYRRRIGAWLLWRLGPSKGPGTTYIALDPDDLSIVHTFDLEAGGTGPSGTAHTRFRTWKEDLRDTPPHA